MCEEPPAGGWRPSSVRIATLLLVVALTGCGTASVSGGGSAGATSPVGSTAGQPLEGTTWVLDGIEHADHVRIIPPGVRSTLRLANGRLYVAAGCNLGSAQATFDDGSVSIGPLPLTRKMCPPDAMAVERAVTTVLQGTVAATVDGGRLRLGERGAALTYHATQQEAVGSGG